MTFEVETTETSTPVLFESLGLSANTLRAITELGYEEPTPIQLRTITQLMEGADVIAQAQTGTGKTAAFALPIIERIDHSIRTPQALILAPTRELAVQVAAAFEKYGKYHRLTVVPIYGGQPIERQLRVLDRGAHIVVGTPGRVIDHLERGTLRLEHVRFLVLDEADEMLDMGFIEDVESILQKVPAERQTALFSATMPNPIAILAKRYMHDPQRITVEGKHVTVPQIRQVVYDVGSRDKFEMLARLIEFEAPTSAIVFCRTKSEVDGLGARLIARGFAAETLHGDLSQIQRDRVMGRFRSGHVKLLIATDVAARGLDIDHVSHVINYDIPFDHEVYVHRVGRTGRAGRAGSAITLVGMRDRRLLQVIERAIGVRIERGNLPTLEDVTARRRDAFRDSLREIIDAGDLERYADMISDLSDEYGPELVAAAALRMLIGEQPEHSHDPLVDEREWLSERRPERRGAFNERGSDRPPWERDREREGIRRPEGRRPAGAPRGDGGPMTRLQLSVGRTDGVRPGDIVGAIANEADIPGRSIGHIELLDRSSFVDVPDHLADRVLRALRSTTIRGRAVAPRLATGRR